ncbi:LysR family transcriptional regulator [Roseibium sp. M-1]
MIAVRRQDLQSWELVKVFLALQRTRSYEGASQILNMDISTVRRKIQSLETSLGMTLFTRDADGVVLQSEHEHMLTSALEMEAAASKFRNQSERIGSAGLVRVTMLDIFATLVLKNLGEFQKNNPEIILDITTETRFVDLEREGVDLAVRAARPLRGAGGVRKLADIPFRKYASKEYLDRMSREPADTRHTISLASDFSHRDHEFSLVDERNRAFAPMDEKLVCRVDSYVLLRQLCGAGMGLARLPSFIADDAPNLIPVDDEVVNIELWLVFRRETVRARRVKETVRFLVDTFNNI